jgi:hypothetical protein
MWIWTAIMNAAARIAVWLMTHGMASATAAQAIGFVIAGTAAIYAGKALMGRLTLAPEIGLGQQGLSILSNAPSNSAPIPVIYGTRRVGGTRVFVGTSDAFNQDGSGEVVIENGFLNMVFVVAEGPVTEISAVYLNNVEAWPNRDPRFTGWEPGDETVYIEPHIGTTTQAASQQLVNVSNAFTNTQDDWAWTSEHKLSGLAYVYVRLAYHPEVWASGVPVMSCDVKGKSVLDYRPTITSGAASIERYSDNPSLAIRDYLTNTVYGRGIDTALIGNTSFNDSADYCDEEVTFTQIVSGITTSVTQKRYTLNGVVNTSETNMDTLQKMLTSCRGSLVFSGGFYKLVLDKTETATLTFDESNVMGDYEIIRGGKDMLANRISANFFNPDREWQADFAFEESAAYKTTDNDLLLEKKIELPFTADMLMAKYIALQNLKASRQNIIINFRTTQDGLLAEIGDVIYIKLANPGWDTLNSNQGKLFRVLQIGIEASDEVTISAIEYDANVYTTATFDWDTSPNTNLPSLTDINPVTNLVVSETLLFNIPTITNRLALSWTRSKSSFVSSYDVAYKKNNDADWIKIGNVNGTQANLDNLDPGVYAFNVRARNNAGFTSEYVTKTFKVQGTSVLPAINPPGITGVTEVLTSSFVGSGVKAKATLSWVAVANADWEALGVTIDRYEVQFKLTSESTTWESPGSSVGTFFEFFDITPGNYNFRVRAVNDANMYSGYAETTAEIAGLTAAPANVASFYLRVDSNEANLSWTPATDLDVKVGGTFEIRHSDVTSGATWEQSIQIGEDVSGISNSAVMPLLKGTYLIKAVDSTGHKSDSATTIVNTITPQLFDYRSFQTITDTSFAGTKTNMVVDADTGYLKFEADTLIDAMTTDIDDWGLFDSIGGVDTSGSYEFADKIDVEVVGSVNLNGAITFTVVNRGDVWDLREGNMDTWLSIDATDFDNVLAQLYVATTNDDPASGGATWGDYSLFTIGNYYGRGFKFKLEASTADNNYQINVSQLKAVADIYYRIQAESSGIGASGSTITFDTSFRATPVLGIAAQNMATGDYYTLSSLSKTGFTLQFFNSSGTGVARTADYIARGY